MSDLNKPSDLELLELAEKAMSSAYSPYSNFKVGAALLTKEGKVYLGCNIENSSYGVTNCAERTALFKAVSEGERMFSAIAIVGGSDGKLEDYCYPCGVCRQALAEFCDEDFRLIFKNGKGEVKAMTLAEILPLAFKLR